MPEGVSTVKKSPGEDKRKTQAHLFKPGQSGNPGGKLKGAPDLHKLLIRILAEDYAPFTLPPGGEAPGWMSNAEAVCRMLVHKAAEGDDRARTELFNRWVGKVKDQVEHSGSIGDLSEDERTARLNAAILRVLSRGTDEPVEGEGDGG